MSEFGENSMILNRRETCSLEILGNDVFFTSNMSTTCKISRIIIRIVSSSITWSQVTFVYVSRHSFRVSNISRIVKCPHAL